MAKQSSWMKSLLSIGVLMVACGADTTANEPALVPEPPAAPQVVPGGQGAPVENTSRHWHFDDGAPGAVPAGWLPGESNGAGTPATWAVSIPAVRFFARKTSSTATNWGSWRRLTSSKAVRIRQSLSGRGSLGFVRTVPFSRRRKERP